MFASIMDHSSHEWYHLDAFFQCNIFGLKAALEYYCPGILLCPLGFWFSGRHFFFSFPVRKTKLPVIAKLRSWWPFITCCVMITYLSSDKARRSLVPLHNSVSFDLILWFFASSSFLSLFMSFRPRHEHFVHLDPLWFLPFACLPHLNGSNLHSVLNIRRSYYSFKRSFYQWKENPNLRSLSCVKAQNIYPEVLTSTSIFLANASRDFVFFLISRGFWLGTLP